MTDLQGMHISPSMAAAWGAYQADLEALRREIYASPLATDPADQARAHYWVMQAQALAFNLAIAPRQSHPTFMVNNVFEPIVYTWILPNADFLYRYAFLEGVRSFRITGRRGASHFLEGQTIGGFFGDPDLKLLKTYDFDRFVLGPNGDIDIVIGPKPEPTARTGSRPIRPAGKSRSSCARHSMTGRGKCRRAISASTRSTRRRLCPISTKMS